CVRYDNWNNLYWFDVW
nr:immunoglobulin heavy chain junction region [Macaca mulatta]